MMKKTISIAFLGLLSILLLLVTTIAVIDENPVTSASALLKQSEHNVLQELDQYDLIIDETAISDGHQISVKNIQRYKKHMLSNISSNADDSQITNQLLLNLGYNETEISNMGNDSKELFLNSKELVIKRTSPSNNPGLNLTITYTTQTLILPFNQYYPVDYYLVTVMWTWDEPTLFGAPDFIGINLEQGKNYYEMMQLYSNSDLGAYEYCRFSYNKKVYDGLTITTTYNHSGTVGEVINPGGASKTSRSFVMGMPKNDIQYDVPSDPFVYKTIYTNFVGEAQFILKINNFPEESAEQLLGITYGHSITEYQVAYSENISLSLGLEATITGPSAGIGLGFSSNWTYTPTNVIISSVISTNLHYGRLNLEHGKVYNIVNLNADRALEYSAGVTQNGTQLRLGTSAYKLTQNNTANPFWQWKIEFNKDNKNIIIRPIGDETKFISFENNRVVLSENPSFVGFSLGISSPIRVETHNYIIPQHNIPVNNCYRVQGGSNYSNIMDYQSDFYSSISYSPIGSTDTLKSTWIFYEVPEDKIAEQSPKEVFSINDVVYLKNVGTGKYLDISGGSLNNGAPALVYTKNSPATYNQQFKITNAGSNIYKIEPYHTIGFNLDVSGGSSSAGAQIQSYVYNGTSAQNFKFYPIQLDNSKVQYFITTAASGYNKVIQANANASVSQETPSLSNTNQFWEIEYIRKDYLFVNGNESYYIRNKGSDYYFDVKEGKTSNNTAVLQYHFLGGNNQRYKFSANGDGSFYITPQHATNRVLEFSNNSNNGNDLKIYSKRNDKQFQRFKFLRASVNGFYILTGASSYSKLIAIPGSYSEVGKQLTQWENLEYNTMQWVIERNHESQYDNTVYLNSLRKVPISGTTSSTYYFKPQQNALYYFATVGTNNTTIEIYADINGNGNYTLRTSSVSGGVDNNASASYYFTNLYRVKIVVRGSIGDNGTSGLIVYKNT